MTSPIAFYIGQEKVTLAEVSPTTTLLNYLRNHKRLTGTKEGCAEGDCGACTVVLGEVVNEQLQFRAVNSCILPISLLDGKQVITVEHLQTGEKLHPVQQAFVDHHASQCGFCTPGFIQSSYAFYLNQYQQPLTHLTDSEQTKELNRIYAGNLCRCTGYGPIIEAGKQIISQANSQALAEEFQRWQANIESLAVEKKTKKKTLSANCEQYLQPTSLKSLCKMLSKHPKATLVAGATDIGLWITKQHKTLPTLINLGEIAALKKIKVGKKSIKIYASVTYSQAFEVLCQYFPEFEEYLLRHSSEQIRNMGTIVGNIGNGSPIGDMPPPLIALGAKLTLNSIAGPRKIDLQDYFIDYGKQARSEQEFIEYVEIPLPQTHSLFKIYKVSKRIHQDISAVSAAFNLELKKGKVKKITICYGGMAGTPKRALQVEAFLTGKAWTQETIQQAMQKFSEDYSPLSDQRASESYRMLVAQNLLQKYFIETSQQSRQLEAIPVQILNNGEIKYA